MNRGRVIPLSLLLAVASLSAAGQNGATRAPVTDPNDGSPWPDAAALADAKRDADNRPLFASAEPLVFSLVADLGRVQRDRNPEDGETYPAKIVLSPGTAAGPSIDVQIRTRGHSRLRPDFCTFAPLRIEFPSNPTGTVFEGQKTLKLGTHCRDQGEYGEYTLREYPVYRMFNLLTANSFRARLAEVHYVNVKNNKTFVRGGLFIENDNDVARRMGGRISESTGLRIRQFDQGMATLTMMFEYLIGNTDVAIRSLHNIRVVLMPDGTRFPVPYDFDFSGVVESPYATPNPMLKLSSTRERLYLGPCQPPTVLDRYVARFRSAREALLGVYDDVPMLKPKYRTTAKNYLDGFFKRLDSPDAVKRAFIDGCETRPYM